jgi:transposase
MEMVKVGKVTLREAGERIGVSYRQAKRIGQAIRERGIKGLVHGNRGRPSNHRLKESLRERVLKLSEEVYWDFNDTHFTEKLRECEGIDLNRETVRKLRREAGMAPKRRRRGPKHRPGNCWPPVSFPLKAPQAICGFSKRWSKSMGFR